jgi:hypothetical protein
LTREHRRDEDRRVTSRMGYWIGAALIVLGVAGGTLFGVLSFTGMGDVVDDFVRAPAPGMVRAELEARKYVVYLEGPGAGRDFVPPVEFYVVDPAGGGLLATAGYGGSLTYSMGGHSGTAQATVTPPRAGTYELRAATAAPPSAGYAVALGESITGRILRTVLGALAIGGVLVGGGIALLVTTGVRRKRRAAGSPPAPPPDPAAVAGLPG